jgi:4-carboxymuconolactone decarboxylase
MKPQLKLLLLASTLTLSTLSFQAAHAAERLPTIAPESYTQEQQEAAEEFMEARGAPVFGPFQPLMHSPRLMNQGRAMGDYLRYNSAIGNTLSELVILVTAREWSQDYEWYVHYPIALRAGIKSEIADAIAEGRRPTGMSEAEEIVYDFSIELHRNKQVSEYTYQRAQKQFGNKGVVDLTGINGYYTFLAMQMNMAQYPLPEGATKLNRFPE